MKDNSNRRIEEFAIRLEKQQEGGREVNGKGFFFGSLVLDYPSVAGSYNMHLEWVVYFLEPDWENPLQVHPIAYLLLESDLVKVIIQIKHNLWLYDERNKIES